MQEKYLLENVLKRNINFINKIKNKDKEEIFNIIEKELNNNKNKEEYLKDILILAKGFYYEEGQWIQEKFNIKEGLLDDKHYDMLERKYEQLTGKQMEIGLNTKIINGEFPKIRHKRFPGISQNKTTNQSTVLTYIKNKKLENEEFILSEKLDGSSLYLIYNKEGKLIKGVTRGDGEYGNDITINVLNINGIVKQLNMSLYPKNTDYIEIRGECIITEEKFNELNSKLKMKNEKTYKNKRNIIPGILMTPYSEYSNYLSFKAYQEIIENNNKEIFENNAIDKFINLKKHNFSVPKFYYIKDINNIFNIYEKYILKERKQLNYDIDGLVIVVNNTKRKNELGITNKKENGSFAFKFPAEAMPTKVKKIHFQLGTSSGYITPVVEVEPVDIEGSTITKISLANEALFKLSALNINDTVYIRKSGDVIPQIVKNEKFDEFYKFTYELINQSLNKLNNNIKEKIINKHCNIYSEEIPLYFNTITQINKIIYEGKDEKNIKEYLKNNIKKFLIKDFNSFLKENKLTKNEKENLIFDFEINFEKVFNKIKDDFELNINKLYQNNILFTNICPNCGSRLNSNGIIAKCTNINCEGKKIGNILTFIEKTGVKGVKESAVNFLYKNNYIKEVKDLFLLKKENFILDYDKKGNPIYPEGWGKRKIENTLEAIEKMKILKPEVFLAALNIENYGKTKFEKILEHFSFEEIINNKLTEEKIQKIEGFDKVQDLISNLKNKSEEIKELLKYIDIVRKKQQEMPKNAIKVYFTGSPKGININNKEIKNKKELFEEIKKVVGNKFILTDKFNKKNCDILVYNGDITTKIQKAKKMNILTISIKELLNNLNNFQLNDLKRKKEEINIDF